MLSRNNFDETRNNVNEMPLVELTKEQEKCDYKESHYRLHVSHVTFQRMYRVNYLGQAVLDPRYTQPMLPWIIAEVRRTAHHRQTKIEIFIEVTDSSLKALMADDNQVLFEHNLQNISKFAQTSQDHSCFSYLTRDNPELPMACHVFQADDESTVLELFTSMREMTKEMSHQSSISSAFSWGNSSWLDNLLTNSQQYEVLYIGKIKVSHKRAPPSFIDEAVEKFRLYELEKLRAKQDQEKSQHRQRRDSGASCKSLPHSLEMVVEPIENHLADQVVGNEENQSVKGSLENEMESSVNRSRQGSGDSMEFSLRPLDSNDSMSRSVMDTRSLVTHTQSMDTAARSSVIQSLHDYEVKRSSSQHLLLPPEDHSLITHTQSLDAPTKAAIVNDLQGCGESTRVRSCSGDMPRATKQNSLPIYRARVNSGSSIDFGRSRSRQQGNRTMLFLIGRMELCFISTDKKQVLLNRMFNDISHCSQGVKSPDHFGFICREILSGADTYVGYVFRCQREQVVDEVMFSLKQAFHSAHQTFQQQQVARNQTFMCESCPMHWFHRLCLDIEGLPSENIHDHIRKWLGKLSEEEKEDIILRYKGTETTTLQEKNEVLMMLFRSYFERKQMKHTHATNGNHSNRCEIGFFEKKSSSKLDSFKEKARKSLSSSFENILKRKVKEDPRERSGTTESEPTSRITSEDHSETSFIGNDKHIQRERSYDVWDSQAGNEKERLSPVQQRPRSSTFSTVKEAQKQVLKKTGTDTTSSAEKSPQHQVSPMMNIFMKVGNRTVAEDGAKTPSKQGSWRQVIFQRVQTPIQERKALLEEHLKPEDSLEPPGSSEKVASLSKRSKSELRALWKKAIMEQIILIRMEKENRKLQARQNAVSNKRLKLDYAEITPCLKDAQKQWDKLLSTPNRSSVCFSLGKLKETVKNGVPRHRRGEVWQFLAEQQQLHTFTPASVPETVDLSQSYSELLSQLTSQQHAILIDLGRTFPSHPYFSQPLGPGQLALFNLLKAYSLLDTEVGYCQGLSFVAGILLLHMSEGQAFQMMKHILFLLGFRRQYKPDMVALQVQMYQLSRLLHDQHRDVYSHLESYEIGPTLYAAPWFLTLFASQFSLGFVSRLFDLIFLQGIEAVFKVALVLLSNHRELLLQCCSFESIMEFLKTTLPSMGIIQMERIFNQVFNLDLSKQLQAYEVEYHVLQEEMLYSPDRADDDLFQKLETVNRNLKRQNMELLEQLQVAHTNVHTLEMSVTSYQNTVKRLEDRVNSLQDERDALLHSVNVMRKKMERLEVSRIGSDTDDDSWAPSLSVIRGIHGKEESVDFDPLELSDLLHIGSSDITNTSPYDHVIVKDTQQELVYNHSRRCDINNQMVGDFTESNNTDKQMIEDCTKIHDTDKQMVVDCTESHDTHKQMAEDHTESYDTHKQMIGGHSKSHGTDKQNIVRCKESHDTVKQMVGDHTKSHDTVKQMVGDHTKSHDTGKQMVGDSTESHDTGKQMVGDSTERHDTGKQMFGDSTESHDTDKQNIVRCKESHDKNKEYDCRKSCGTGADKKSKSCTIESR
ncbi:TBC1 domain family member 4-like isoform X2 [Limulus polyphemus]|uniref:TBC1 domain family member 4-like isoform X2 n=1 Tax=Limulus polyphemus TaxID=6850 RepID=A0ABM1TIL3_LIMPO|nr:TBC1 domain family member 4-like isoform X2 [Limulus polyphemus]